jgi:hypothetical protein
MEIVDLIGAIGGTLGMFLNILIPLQANKKSLIIIN